MAEGHGLDEAVALLSLISLHGHNISPLCAALQVLCELCSSSGDLLGLRIRDAVTVDGIESVEPTFSNALEHGVQLVGREVALHGKLVRVASEQLRSHDDPDRGQSDLTEFVEVEHGSILTLSRAILHS